MDDIGNIIYFVALIAIFVFSMIKKMKENDKKIEAQKQNAQKEVEADPWSEFEEMFGQVTSSDELPVFDTSQTSVTVSPKSKPLSYETATNYSELRVKNRMKKSVSKTSSIFSKPAMKSAGEMEGGANFEVEFEDEDDVRRAFIYSEIFNRKYN